MPDAVFSTSALTLAGAKALDQRDPLADFRQRFHIPTHEDGAPQRYFCGNSLGLQPRSLADEMAQEVRRWAELGVAGHFDGPYPWMPYHEFVREPLAALVGAQPAEVVAMNTLTTNLHLMLVSFFRPQGKRTKIVIEKGAFPSDRYAVHSQLRFHGLNPEEHLIELEDSDGSCTVSLDTLQTCLQENSEQIALVLMPGVQYASGQLLQPAEVVALSHAHGAIAGFDLAHAVGNVPLSLHDDQVDFAVWCSYKYLNAGPGAIAGAFVHANHHQETLPRFEGWWGHRADTRFLMGYSFDPADGADAWALSNPPIMAMAPLRVSLAEFERTSMTALREKSVRLTGYFQAMVDARLAGIVGQLTPRDAAQRGCQLSLRMPDRDTGRKVFNALTKTGYVTDWREPDIIRAAPVPLYNRFEDVYELVDAIATSCQGFS